MNKIQIFIVTGNGIEKEFLEISDFINEINKHFERAYKISVDLMTIEDLEAPVWKQEEYKEKICGSEMVFFLIFTEMSNYIMEDFEAAFKKLKSDGKPDIYTYFYKGTETKKDRSVQNFMDRLSNEIGHYWSVYDHIDTIKLKILMCLKLSKLDMVEMCFRNGKLVIDEKDVMSLENVKMFSENDSMKILMEKKSKIEKEYIAAKSLYLQNNKDDDIRKKYIEIYTEKENILKSIEETEKQLFKQSLNMIKTARGELTERQVEAYRLFEEGKAEIANKILGSEEIKNDFETRMQKRKEEDKRLASIYIGEFKTKIEILETMTEYPERFKEIEDSYEEITKTAFKYDIEYNAVCHYIIFLHNQGKIKEAFKIGKAIEEVYDKNKSISKYDKSHLLDILGAITSFILGMQNEAEKYYLKAIEIQEELVKYNAERYNSDLAISYNNIGSFYNDQGKVEKAEKYYLKAIKIWEELVKYNAERYSPALASSYNNVGIFYYNQGEAKRAEAYYLKSIEIREELVKYNADKYNSNLASSYNNAGVFYHNLGEAKKAETYYLKSMKIREELVKKDAEGYSFYLVIIYNNIGSLYDEQGEAKKAEKYYLKAIEIYEVLYEKNAEICSSELAVNYNNVSLFYNEQGETEKAEEYILKAIEIMEKLVKENVERFSPVLANIYNSAGLFYSDKREIKKTEEYFLKAIEIRKELVKENSKRYIPDLAASYNSVGSFYARQGKAKKAEEYFLKAVKIYEELVKKNAEKYNPDLAISYTNIGVLYGKQGEAKKAKEYYLKAIDIQEKLVEKCGKKYEPNLVISYFNYGTLKKDNEYLKKAFKLAKKNMHNPDCRDIVEQLKKSIINEKNGSDSEIIYSPKGIFYNDQGGVKQIEQNYLDAIEQIKSLVKINPEKYGPDLANSYNAAGAFYNSEEEIEEAEKYYLKAIDIREELSKINPEKYSPALAISYNNMGVFYNNIGEIEEAEKYFLNAIDVKKELSKINPEKYNSNLADSYNGMGIFYKEQEETEEAEKYFLNAIKIREELVKKYGKKHEANLAMSYFNYGDLKKDDEYLEKAFNLSKENMNNSYCRKIVEQLRQSIESKKESKNSGVLGFFKKIFTGE